MMQTVLFLVVGSFIFCIIPFGVIYYAGLPEEKKKDPTAEEKKTLPVALAKVEPKKQAEVKKDPEKTKEPEPKKSDDKKVDTKPDPKKIDEPKKVEPKKEEAKKEEVKKEEPKKEEPKKEEPKQPDPKPAPPMEPIRLANAYLPLLAEDAIKIDGDLSDWKNIRPLFLTAVERGKPTKKVAVIPKTQKAYVAYSPQGILVAVDVVDTSGVLENAGKPARGMWPFWDNDAVEIYIDTLNRRPRHRGEANAHQFFALPLGTPNDPGIGGYESRILGSAWSVIPYPSTGRNSMPSAGKRTRDGWTLEMLIPRSALRLGDMKPGGMIGFEMQIDTGTNVFYFWSNDNPDVRPSTNPSSWGEIAFAGTDAKLDLLDAKGQPTGQYQPGQPIRVHIEDADLNLDPNSKEKTSVTLLSKSGDRKTLTLEETGPNTGMFAGSIETGPKKTAVSAKILGVLPKDVVVIEYLDLIRANGGRNFMVRGEFSPAK